MKSFSPGYLPRKDLSGQHLPASLLVGGIISLMLLSVAVFAPLLAPYPPNQINASDKLLPPSLDHYFGTDDLGRDLYSRVIFGSRIALFMTALSTGFSFSVGIVLGLAGGYLGGKLDQVLSRLMDIWLSLPTLLLAIIIVTRLGPSITTSALALGIAGVPSFFRLARAETISKKQLLFVEAATAMGRSNRGIILFHIIPNISSSLVIMLTMRMGTMLLAAGGLSFIGLGAQPPQPEWGALLAQGRSFMNVAPWLAVFPGLLFTISVVGINLLGDGLRDWLDPQHRR